MEFRKEVQEILKKAGWYSGRDVRDKFNDIYHFEEFPEFLKEFLYEYGDLVIETQTEFAKGTLDLKAITSGFFSLDDLNTKAFYGKDLITYPIGYYSLDNTVLECDLEGRVYMDGDFPTLMSEDFKEGIEKVIMEDYSNTKEWHPNIKEWRKEKY